MLFANNWEEMYKYITQNPHIRFITSNLFYQS